VERPGYFWEPTVLCDVPDDSLAANEEPFGPMALLTSWTELEDLLPRANRLPVGLAGYVFTGNHALARRLALEIDCGALAINGWRVSSPQTPFGGHGDSGVGNEGGIEGTDAFQQIKYIDDQTNASA
jgi:succinate-semialdehyde dehydrogenase/glutarate-semialdehyde dehydrogenase